MSLRNLPEIKAFDALQGVTWETRSDAMEQWPQSLRAMEGQEGAVISIYDVIGQDPWSEEAVTTKRVAGLLRKFRDQEISVNINSPGGDFFEGISIYNLLRNHPHKVTVRVPGLAASAASVIAMAGDEIQVAKAAHLMVHNAWGVTIGNRHDLAATIQKLEPFDRAMAEVYADRSGLALEDVTKMMDEETFVSGQDAVELGLADALLPADSLTEDQTVTSQASALRRVDALMRKAGCTRAKSRALLKDLTGDKPGAVSLVMPCADELQAGLDRLLKSLKD